MSKINLALELNPESLFNQNQGIALSSLILSFTDSVYLGEHPQNTAIEKAISTGASAGTVIPKEEKATTTTTSKAKTAAQKKAEAEAAKKEAEKNAEASEETETEKEVETIADVKVGKESGVTPEDIKVIVGKKVEVHRDTIKAELSRLGFDSLPLYLKSGNDLGDFKKFLENLA